MRSIDEIFQLIENVDLCLELFRRSGSDETIFHRDETIFRLPSRTAETVRRYVAPAVR